MIIRILYLFLITCLPITIWAQNGTKKMLGHEELVTWRTINRPQISDDGNWVVYELKSEEGDGLLKIYNVQKDLATNIPRGTNAKISADSRFVVFMIQPSIDTIKMLRRQNIKEEDLPKEALGIFDLQNRTTERIEKVASFKLPEKWSNWVVYKKEAEAEITETIYMTFPDSNRIRPKRKRPKVESKKDGTKLVLKSLLTNQETVFPFVTDYQIAKKSPQLVFLTTGNDSTFLNGIYRHNLDQQLTTPLYRSEGDYKQLVLDETGTQVAFLANIDTTDALIPPYELVYWTKGQDSAHIIAKNKSAFLFNNWIINEHKAPSFSENGKKLYFGQSPKPILEDSTLLKEETVEVEVWHWEDAQLHTQQKVRQKREENRAYSVVWHTDLKRFVTLGSLEIPEIRRGKEGNAAIVLGYNKKPYEKLTSWEGFPAARDLFLIDTRTGVKRRVAKAVKGIARLSPNAQFIYTYVPADSAWFTYAVATGKRTQLTHNKKHPFFDELNDQPRHPPAYGVAGWLENDRYILIYDRYDIWKIDPKGKETPINLTKGRKSKIRYRLIQLDKEERFIKSTAKLLLHVFDECTKESGYSLLEVSKRKLKTLTKGAYTYNRYPLKAKDADKLLFTRSNFEVFPDLHYTDFSFKKTRQISLANPQQKDYLWGNAEPYEWTALDGKKRQGIIIKPENFDPHKKYPMIVNFYERNSHRLYRHHPPSAGRSTINYSFYTSRGYIIFNPDIVYDIGTPGESCYNSVVGGVKSLINEGFIDEENIGLQGHSWGGYQVAYLLNKTNLFKCAESGAPVVNMVSAYGGIRWGSGLSRMFQYEKTQSRMGGSLWEYPERYLENSPIFELDKMSTPVLILHNDEDAAVPWYQGIEYFVALRRLGKPAWLLNYNGEPHWPVKLRNRKDFNIRMQQYFDYYLKGALMPQWMQSGVSAMEKGKRQGLELIKEGAVKN